jgi:predicted nucleic acid-binding protein
VAERGRIARSKDPRAQTLRLLVDTNVLVRHVTGDPPSQARRATEFLRAGHELLLTDVVLAEVVYVLDSVYGFPRPRVAEAGRSLLALPEVAVIDAPMLLRALELYETLRLDFAEAYLAAAAERFGLGKVASFARALDRVATIERVEP